MSRLGHSHILHILVSFTFSRSCICVLVFHMVCKSWQEGCSVSFGLSANLIGVDMSRCQLLVTKCPLSYHPFMFIEESLSYFGTISSFMFLLGCTIVVLIVDVLPSCTNWMFVHLGLNTTWRRYGLWFEIWRPILCQWYLNSRSHLSRLAGPSTTISRISSSAGSFPKLT